MFCIDLKGCCCCSCNIAAAAAALFPIVKLKKTANKKNIESDLYIITKFDTQIQFDILN